MSFIQRVALGTGVTTAGGALTLYSPVVTGLVERIEYVPDATSPLDTNGDIVVTGEVSAAPVLTKANIGLSAVAWHPRIGVNLNTDGAAAVFIAAGQPILDKVAIANERIKLVIAQGGNALASGAFYAVLS